MWFVLPLGVALLAGCDNKAKLSEQKAVEHVAETAKLIDADVEEIRQGLPEGSKKLVEPLAEGGGEVTPARARKAMKKVREAVVKLQLSKATFFAVTDLEGVAYASDQETDELSGKNLLQAYKGLEKAKGGSYTEVIGEMNETKGVRQGDDVQWVAAAPIAAADGKVTGLYVAGWSFRRFTFHLEEQLKSNLRSAVPKGSPIKLPLVYVYVLRDGKAYGTPAAPEVNIKAVEGLGLPGKLGAGGGGWQGQVEITGRSFGAAALPAKKLCDQCAVVVLRSEI